MWHLLKNLGLEVRIWSAGLYLPFLSLQKPHHGLLNKSKSNSMNSSGVRSQMFGALLQFSEL
jgi:hypothetical protein